MPVNPCALALGWKLTRNLAEAYEVMGRHADADDILAELLEKVRASGDSQLEYSVRLERARIRLATGPDPMALDAIRGEAERALKVFEGAGDEAGLSQACHVLGLVHLRLGELRDLEEVARRGLAHAERSGNAREELGARWSLSTSSRARRPSRRAFARVGSSCDGAGQKTPGSWPIWPRCGRCSASSTKRASSSTAPGACSRSGCGHGGLWGQSHGGPAEVEIVAGDFAAGERELRNALELGHEMGERDQVSQIAGSLSLFLSVRGATEEAARLASVSADQAPAESVAAQALWRAATARVLANHDDARGAEGMAREAIALLPVEMLNLAAELRVNLFDILRATGQRDAAQNTIGMAIDLYERKGNIAAGSQARSRAAALEPAPLGQG